MPCATIAILLVALSAPPEPDSDAAKLEAEIAKELGAAPQPPAATPAAPAAPAAAPTGGNPYARLLVLPDISAIGRGGLSYVSPDTGRLAPRDRPFGAPSRVRPVFDELELGLQAVVDPYARADVFLSFSETGAGVEEAYVTWLRLPYGLLARAGQLYTPFGRVNPQHPHAFEFADKPLATQRLLAPETLGGPGVTVAWLAPLPWFAEVTLAYQSVPPATPNSDAQPGGFVRVANFFDAGERTTLGAGASAGLSEEPGGWRDLAGGDLLVRWRPGATGAYVALQGEVLARRLRAAGGDGTSWAAYAQSVWRPGRRIGYGARVERAPAPAGGEEWRTSGLLLLDPSEFQRFRLQAGWSRLPGGRDGVEALLHVEFTIGAHGAHAF